MRYAITLILLLMPMIGCVGALRVHELEGSESLKREGIPFYRKTQICRQTSVWTVSWLDVSISEKERIVQTVTNEIKVTDSSIQKNMRRVDKDGLQKIRELQSLVMAHNSCQLTGVTGSGCPGATKINNAFADLPPACDPQEAQCMERLKKLISNSSTPVVVVDYEREFFLNGKLPWFGETTVTAKLHEDGTLSEASTTVKSDPAAGLGALIPFKELLTAELGLGAATAEETDTEEMVGAGKPSTFRLFELSVEEDGYKYSFTADTKDASGLCQTTTLSPIGDFGNAGVPLGNFKIEPLKTKSAAKKENDAPKIEFSGNVKLPTSAPAGS